ncbi:transporter substrate-binding domain-containing protein [Companilactobacillus alimentarius]|uniref:Amino acid ABC transporter substrate-binding protein n=1 Tax=Companilactobacillus alimentarius DSM 20249 TaxID=1423720 RepID=A0A2K9HQ73_9LACO|nr:transporter substrate-binding domain-containing protein [Companilactobacillus alimentarius]AUI71672.1 amino acid ABC transporter substrate-binding protein [Companilactobacillus alimentarius DSM 20249]KRK78314.1 amino acid ABC transporter substrate-binding component [Companilactobacillus alimentarius DSM 20249]MDT6953336.1 transporter substrate-binding domain-containing protein [Companilactobacillus alimentarius]GEO44586.1 amino acid ABC transporter substrate-binding protein [Companilactobaci
MKKRIALILTTVVALILVLTGCSNKNSANNDTKTQGTLTVGLEGTYAPYSYRDDGKLKGFEVDLAKDIAKKLDLKTKFVPTKWDSLIAGLNSNTFDVVFNNVAKNPSRKKHYIFSTPYIYSKSVIITKDGTGINSVDDIKGKKISAGTGTDNYNHAEKFGAKVVPAADFQTDMSMIDQGRVAGAINSREAFLYWKKSHKNTDLKYITIPDNKLEPSEIAPIYNKKSTHLRGRVNKAIKELYKDGTMKKLSIKYFGEDITKK